MFIITGKNDSAIFGYGENLEYLENGYPTLVDYNIAWNPNDVIIQEVSSVPEQIEVGKYCYTGAEGFYINPNWVEPNPDNTYEGVSDEVFEQILSDYREKLAEEVAGNGYNS